MSSLTSAIAILATISGTAAFVAPRPTATTSSSSSSSLFASPSIGIFFGTSTGSTQDAADLISAEFGDVASEPIEIDEVQGSVAEQFSKFDALVVGTPTWNTG